MQNDYSTNSYRDPEAISDTKSIGKKRADTFVKILQILADHIVNRVPFPVTCCVDFHEFASLFARAKLPFFARRIRLDAYNLAFQTAGGYQVHQRLHVLREQVRLGAGVGQTAAGVAHLQETDSDFMTSGDPTY